MRNSSEVTLNRVNHSELICQHLLLFRRVLVRTARNAMPSKIMFRNICKSHPFSVLLLLFPFFGVQVCLMAFKLDHTRTSWLNKTRLPSSNSNQGISGYYTRFLLPNHLLVQSTPELAVPLLSVHLLPSEP